MEERLLRGNTAIDVLDDDGLQAHQVRHAVLDEFRGAEHHGIGAKPPDVSEVALAALRRPDDKR